MGRERGAGDRRRLALVVVAVVVAGVVAPFATIGFVHARDRIVNGGRLWRCELVGGSWPVEAASIVRLRPGLSFGFFGAVDDGEGWVSVVEVIDTATRQRRGEGAFVLGDRAGARVGGIDATATEVAGVRSTDGLGAHHREVAAARECLHRRLPVRARGR